MNTEWGYECGDELLRKLGGRLRSTLRAQHLPSAFLARMGSDEFALLMTNVDDGVVRRISRDLLKSLRKPFVLQGQPISISCRAGAAKATSKELGRFGDLLARASIAMDQARSGEAHFHKAHSHETARNKTARSETARNETARSETARGETAKSAVLSQPPHDSCGNTTQGNGGQVVFFESEMEKQTRSRVAFEKALSQAISNQQFRIRYQPIVDLNATEPVNPPKQTESLIRNTAAVKFKTVGFEALIRWQHPEHGLLQPAQFLPVAEKMGLMIQLDRWVMETVCKQLTAWRQSSLVVNVNLSANHLTQPDLVDYIERLLHYYPVSPRQLNLEITEGELISDMDKAIAVLHQIRALGLSISLDDFGTGYSSLDYLDKLPADVIKLDQSFIRRMSASAWANDGALSTSKTDSHQARTSHIVKSILDLAADLNLRVVAEGIEQVEQLELLKRMHCGYGQGYLFSRPTSAQRAEALI